LKLLLVAATRFEIDQTVTRLESFQYDLKSTIIITGPGIFNTGFSLGKQFAVDAGYDLVIDAGICGSYSDALIPGACVSVIEDCLADFGAEDNESFLHASQLGFYTVNEKWITATALHLTKELPQVRGITVNTVSGNTQTIEARRRIFEPDIESMEGAAFFLACRAFMLPSIQIRSVSNKVEPRNRKNWNVPVAVESLNSTLEQLLNNLTS